MPSSLNGTGLTFNSGATLNSPPVTSIATGNGLQGGTITTTGTLSIAAPAFNTVGSYVNAGIAGTTAIISSGASLSAGGGLNQVMSSVGLGGTNNLSGTWRWMAAPTTSDPCRFFYGIACRIA